MGRVGIFLLATAVVAGIAGCGPYPYSLTISSTEGGEVTTPGEGRFAYSEVTAVSIVADASEGHRFIAWTGHVGTVDDINAPVTTITVNGDYSITANFCPETSGNLEIRTWYDLAAVRCNLASNHTLMNDLDSTTAGYEELASPTANGGQGWQPLGTEDHRFTGTFDGQGYEIRELFIDRPGEYLVGLFCYVDVEGVITNTGVVNATITGNVGVGGLAGGNLGNVANCYATGNVTGYAYVGGLMSGNGGTVSYCYSTGSVTGTGTLEYLGSVVGGLVAGNGGTVNHSYFAGDVTGTNHTVGGLVGLNEMGSVVHSYATGSTTGSHAVGGLVGLNAGNVSESYSVSSVTGDRSVGGLVGRNVRNVTNSFWDIQTSGQATSDGGTGKTTEEMQDITTFSGAAWDIVAVANLGMRNLSYIWNIVDDETYPFLSWQS